MASLQLESTVASLQRGDVVNRYLDLNMKTVLETLGTNNDFLVVTLQVAEEFSRPRLGKPVRYISLLLHRSLSARRLKTNRGIDL